MEIDNYYQSNIKTSRQENGVYAMRYANQQMLIDELQQENQQLKEKIEKINNYLDKNYTMENQFWFDHIQDIVKDR